jgi:CBS domain-containing protein
MDKIRFFMEETLIGIEPTASVREAAQKMRHHSISSILIGEENNFTGLLTDTDLTRKFAGKNLDSDKTLASTISNNPIITMDANYPMEDAYECMKKNNIRHLGVTENDKLAGILSIKDFANYYHNKFCNETEEEGEVRYFMNNSIFSIDAEKTVLDAVDKMTANKVGALIVSESGKVKGVFSESALTMNVIAAGRPLNTPLSAILICNVIAIDSNQSMSSAYQKMRENNIRHLSVSRGKKIIGMLSIKDFVNYYNFKFCQCGNNEDQIGQHMHEDLQTVPEATSIQKAAQIMKENKIGSLLVTLNNDITGIVTEEIFTRQVLGNNLNPETTLVSELMEKPATIKSVQSMDSALSCMHQNDAHYLVVTEDNKIKGIISLKDLTIYFKHKFVTAQDINN